jgi:hypothetical protein
MPENFSLGEEGRSFEGREVGMTWPWRRKKRSERFGKFEDIPNFHHALVTTKYTTSTRASHTYKAYPSDTAIQCDTESRIYALLPRVSKPESC